jgi:hypothetical protein
MMQRAGVDIYNSEGSFPPPEAVVAVNFEKKTLLR